MKMKFKTLLGGVALVGAFSIGALLSPITESTATTINEKVVNPLSSDQTAEQNNLMQENMDEICPITGEARGMARMGRHFAGSEFAPPCDTFGPMNGNGGKRGMGQGGRWNYNSNN